MIKPTIAQALAEKLQRTPTHKELVAEVSRILASVTVERAGKGKLREQRKRPR